MAQAQSMAMVKWLGIAVAVEGWSGYFPIAHEGGGNMDRALVLDWFEEVLHTDATKIFHNAMYDVSWIRSMGFYIRGGIIDTLIAASLIDENRWGYALNALGKQYVGMGKNEKILNDAAKAWGVDPKAEMWRLPAPLVGEYAEQDAVVTLKLWHALQHEISKQDLWDVFNLETNLFPCLIDMKFKGVRVNVEQANILKQELIKEEKDIYQGIHKLVGFDVEIWAAASIAKAFDEVNYRTIERRKVRQVLPKTFYQRTLTICRKQLRMREKLTKRIQLLLTLLLSMNTTVVSMLISTRSGRTMGGL